MTNNASHVVEMQKMIETFEEIWICRHGASEQLELGTKNGQVECYNGVFKTILDKTVRD